MAVALPTSADVRKARTEANKFVSAQYDVVRTPVLAWIGANTIRAFLFQVEPFDPLTLTAVAGTILTLALIVSVRPALRAARVDLGTVLKDQ